MYATARQQRILDETRREGYVDESALPRLLGFASEAVRRDLTALENRGAECRAQVMKA
ncbi:DeoR family transcriptional regulator [Demequina sp. NBRC 110052]|uniref:DeoR family transcriptional regulator n=1 Tax=Demequina sp. NBRC 110052 TaxID=1570341 RepID=UPI000A02B159|nr:DeoR family transcriptional regulator [Demequina sp. NBRC 110052]